VKIINRYQSLNSNVEEKVTNSDQPHNSHVECKGEDNCDQSHDSYIQSRGLDNTQGSISQLLCRK
jgi:hypothetical protein